MRLAQRQYFYIAAIVGLAIYNGVRIYRARHTSGPTAVAVHLAPGTSPAWSLFDKAAALRDAEYAQFHPALQAFSQGVDNTNSVSIPPQTSKDDLADLRGCQTWLLFYRQEFLHPSVNKPGWREQTQQHVLSCAADHRDAAR